MDSIVLQINLVPAVVNPPPASQNPQPGTLHARVYAKNHNVFRIADGFGGVLFTI
jgi:hypothetical protein